MYDEGDCTLHTLFLATKATVCTTNITEPSPIFYLRGDAGVMKQWCYSLRHCHFCIAKMGTANRPRFLIPLAETLKLVIQRDL